MQSDSVWTRVIRPGDDPPADDWADKSMSERVNAVWLLTRICYGWVEDGDEPRLQRSVVSIQRPES